MKKLDVNKFGVEFLNTTEMNEQNGGGLVRFGFRVNKAFEAFFSAFENAGIAYDNISAVTLIQVNNGLFNGGVSKL